MKFDMKEVDKYFYTHIVAEGWFSKWNMPYERSLLSDEGFVIFFNEKPICMGFLYLTNSKVGIIENLVSDPLADKNIVDQGLDHLVMALVERAKRHGIKCLYAFTDKPCILERGERLGFAKSRGNMSLLTRRLG